MAITENDVLALLTAHGCSPTEHFLVGGLVCFINTRGQLMATSIEDPELAVAVNAYLRRMGVPDYQSFQKYRERGAAQN